ncbi:MAG TPA: WYL domain-containing protein [Longimicrobiaceae bacterium]|nr:WYL domain-containing protein [Longimicrobiaceae bacterium]
MTEPTKPTKLQRWLDLIAFLVERRYPVSAEQIMDALTAYVGPHDSDDPRAHESSRKMFERDKKELREMGIPIETVPYTVEGEASEGYRLSKDDFYLPFLELLDRAGEGDRPRGAQHLILRDADAADAGLALSRLAGMPAMPLAREASHALRKLSFNLHCPASTGELWVEHPDAARVRDLLVALAEAVARRKRVRFRYHGIYRGEATDRDVAGYGLLFLKGNWYLVGHDALREDRRIFRVDRMEHLEVNSKSPRESDYDVPADFDLAGYRDKDAWELGEGAAVEVEVRFRFPRSLWAERNGHGERVRAEPDGVEVRRFEVHQVNPFLRWILTQEGEAQILAPPEMRAALSAMALQVAALYRRGPAG